jgi:beta-lactam-binding protein with PASTA domain
VWATALQPALAQRAGDFPMPGIEGLSVQQAEQRVTRAGSAAGARSAKATVRQYVYHPGIPRDRIVRQFPPAGTPVRPYMDDVGGVYGQVSFQVDLSRGPPRPTSFPMPEVVGLTIPQAESVVASASRAVGGRGARAQVVGEQPGDRPAGTILRQLERPGTAMSPSRDDVGGNYGVTGFRVVLSTGPEPAPNFVGMQRNEALDAARRAEIDLSIAGSVRNPRVPAGVVTGQSPAPGQAMSRRRVSVELSAGYPLPDLVGRSYDDALRIAQRLGFELQPRGERHPFTAEGVVFEQRPGADTLLPLRGPVSVGVSRGWPVPEFIGRSEDEARRMAGEARISLDSARRDNARVPAGMIFAQSPEPGRLIPPDRRVGVSVSAGMALPDLTGRTEDEAREIAAELGFGLEVEREPVVDRPAGRVHRQSPAPGATRLPLQRPVQVTVSRGWPTPNLVGLQEDAAQRRARDRQVRVEVSARARDRDNQPGIVIAQRPQAGALLPPGQPVQVTLSTGYPTPDFVGLQDTAAQSLARRETIGLRLQQQPSPDVPAGVVLSQRPAAGAPLPADSRVALTVSSGWTVPDFVGSTLDEARAVAEPARITLSQAAAREDFDMAEGLITAQQPAAGTALRENRQVEITLSLGWPRAPQAIGRDGESVRSDFLRRHPRASVTLRERALSREAAGTVIAQRPSAGARLDRGQNLSLEVAGGTSLWLWSGAGLAVLALGAGMVWIGPRVAGARAYRGSSSTDPARGIHLRVTKDPGTQTTAKTGRDQSAAPAHDDVELRVKVDMGVQTAGPQEPSGGEK